MIFIIFITETGFNSTLRRGCITYHEYLQVGKGRDVGLNQISKFEAKVSNGNSEQTLSRDIYRLGHWFDFFRMLSCYFTTIGFYFSNLVIYFHLHPVLFFFVYYSNIDSIEALVLILLESVMWTFPLVHLGLQILKSVHNLFLLLLLA